MWLLALAALLVVIAVAINQAEGALHVWPERRLVVDPKDAAAVARETGSQWEEVEVRASDGVALRGWHFLPRQWRGRAVLALHGFTDSRRGMLPHVELLLRHGYAVLIPDSRAHGRSEGTLVTFGLVEQADVPVWADWLVSRLGINEYFAIGNSMGAAVLVEALRRERRVKAAILECCFTSFPEIALDRLAGRFKVPRVVGRVVLLPVSVAGFTYIRWRYGLDLRRLRPVDTLREVRIPLLLIHGTGDQAIPYRHSRRLHEANPGSTVLWEVPGAGHVSAITAASAEYERRLLGLFDDQTKIEDEHDRLGGDLHLRDLKS
jgi:pimeloyl-ACP methyl ester carboxylesterase